MKGYKYIIPALLAIALTATSCRHEEGDTVLQLRAEALGGNHKMAVEGINASWCSGDSVWINGSSYRINIENGRANTLVPHPNTNIYNAVFPASIVLNESTVRLPAEYHYTTDGAGRQLLNLPMATSLATSEGTELFFRHLTGALIVKFVNRKVDTTVVLDRITVTSSLYAISGERSTDTLQGPITANNAADRSVTMYFDRQVTNVAPDDTVAVMIPVAPVGNSNQFTIEVCSHFEGKRYTVSNTQQSSNPLGRNKLGYAYMVAVTQTPSEFLFPYTSQQSIVTLHINTASDFILMQKAINEGWRSPENQLYSTLQYAIDNNIDMSGYEIEPISGFTGAKFDGGSHTISNLTINSTSSEYCALFETIGTSTQISNLTLRNVSLKSNYNTDILYVSALAGQSSGTNTISNCNISINGIQISGTTSSRLCFGGFAAKSSSLTLNGCSFSGADSLAPNCIIRFGGFIGEVSDNNNLSITASNCKIGNCNFTIVSNGGQYVGGLIGDSKSASVNITGCNFNINLITQNTTATLRAGGLIGNLSTSSSYTFAVNNDTISGSIDPGNSSNTNIGTLYGRGKAYTNYQINNYIIGNFDIPDKSYHNPSGYPSTQSK